MISRSIFFGVLVLVTVGLITPGARADSAEMAPQSLFSMPAQPLRDAPSFCGFSGKPSLVILFQPDCAWCRVQFKEAAAFKQAHSDIAIVAMSLKGSRRDLLKELRAAGADESLPAYRSSPSALEALLNPQTTPLIYAVDAEGRLRAAARGLQKQAQLEAMILKAQ